MIEHRRFRTTINYTSLITLLSAVITGLTTTPAAAQTASIESFRMQCKDWVIRPAQFRTRQQRILVFEASPEYNNIPAEISWRETKIQVEPARHRYETQPAVYDYIEEAIEVERPRTEVYATAAHYRQQTRRVKIRDAHQQWRKNCTARIDLCLIRVPDEYLEIETQLIDVPARISQRLIPGRTITVPRKVLRTPGVGHGGIIPARYATVKLAYISQPWQIVTTQRPPEYRHVTTESLQHPAERLEVPTLCLPDTSSAQWQRIQQALNTQGYPTPITGVWDNATKSAIIAFQQDRQLSVGAITHETLRRLSLL